MLKIALDVPEDDFYIGMIRRVGRTLMEHHDNTVSEADDLELILGELCSNVTRHARSAGGFYWVSLEHYNDHVVVVVADQGRGFQSKTAEMAQANNRIEPSEIDHITGVDLIGKVRRAQTTRRAMADLDCTWLVLWPIAWTFKRLSRRGQRFEWKSISRMDQTMTQTEWVEHAEVHSSVVASLATSLHPFFLCSSSFWHEEPAIRAN